MQLRLGCIVLGLIITLVLFSYGMDSEYGSKLQTIVSWQKNYMHTKEESLDESSLVTRSIKALFMVDAEKVIQQIKNYKVKKGFSEEIALQLFEFTLRKKPEYSTIFAEALPFHPTMAIMAACSNETLSRYEKIDIIRTMQKKYEENYEFKHILLEFLMRYLPSSSNVDQYITIQEPKKNFLKVIKAVSKDELFMHALETNEPLEVLGCLCNSDLAQWAIDYCLKLKYQVQALRYSPKKYTSSFLIQRLKKLLAIIPNTLKKEIQTSLLLYTEGILLCWQDPSWTQQSCTGEIRMVQDEEYRSPKQVNQNEILENIKFYNKALKLIKNLS